jgi:superfamily II helicase
VEEDLSRYLWSFERVFHRDKNKLNNSKENLGLRYIFDDTRRRWFIDKHGNFDRWNSKGLVITKDNKVHIVPREFSKKIRTNATMPPYPYNLYDHVIRKDDETGVISHFVGATCKLCGKRHWQNVTKQNDTLDYDQICKDCTKGKLLKNWQTMEKTLYWLEDGRDILVTFKRFGRYCYLADMRFDTIHEPLAKVLVSLQEVDFWLIPVDNSATPCIVKEA